MKKTKDTVTSQLTTAEKQNLIAKLSEANLTHISISPPMDTNAQMIAAGTTPSPRTMEAEIQEWCDLIHAVGLKVIHRGTFSGTENIWGFPYYTFGGANALSIGTDSSAASDGENSFCGRIRRYILTTVGTDHWQTGDIFAPIPEATSHAFDGNAFWDTGDTANYSAAFNYFKATSDAAFTSIGKTVMFMSHNNYSEVRSGYIPSNLFSTQNIAAFDYYGQYQGTGINSVASYITDLSAVYTAKSVTMFQGEWGDIAGEAIPTYALIAERLRYLINFYKSYRDSLVGTSQLVGFNYWGGWEGQNTSLLYKDGNGNYQWNARGKILMAFYKSNGGIIRTPVVTAGTTDDNYRF